MYDIEPDDIDGHGLAGTDEHNPDDDESVPVGSIIMSQTFTVPLLIVSVPLIIEYALLVEKLLS